MARNQTTWVKGQSGNPKGRPPKGRALTEKLAAASQSTVIGEDGKEINLKSVLARMMWEGVITGQVTFAVTNEEEPERVVKLEMKDWLDLAKNMVVMIDGPAKADLKVDVTSKGKEVLTADTMIEASKAAEARLREWEKSRFGEEEKAVPEGN